MKINIKNIPSYLNKKCLIYGNERPLISNAGFNRFMGFYLGVDDRGYEVQVHHKINKVQIYNKGNLVLEERYTLPLTSLKLTKIIYGN